MPSTSLLANFARAAMLLAFLSAIFVALGYLAAGPVGMVVAFGIAIAMNVFSYWNSDKMVLKMYGAQEVDARSAPEYYRIVEQLARNAQLPMPRVYIMNSEQPNAFATGRDPDHAAVCASTGLLERLDDREVAAVMAHELAHIKNRDTLIMTIAATIGGAISMIAQYLQFSMLFGGGRRDDGGGGLGMIGTIAAMLLAPFAAMLVQMAISRSREYQADRLGSMICGNPMWLASALTKIQGAAQQTPFERAERAPATAHMFIINPLTGRGMDSLFSTHPNTENRILELEKLAREFGSQASVDDLPRSNTRQDHNPGPWNVSASGSEDRKPGPWSKTADRSRNDSDDGSNNNGGSARGPWG